MGNFSRLLLTNVPNVPDTARMTDYTRGIDLKLERVALRVLAKDLAERMGTHPNRVSVIENLDRVTPAAAAKYRKALATFGTVPSPEQVA